MISGILSVQNTMIFDLKNRSQNKFARKLASSIIINQRGIYTSRNPSDHERLGLVHRLRTLLVLRALEISSTSPVSLHVQIQESRLRQLFAHMLTQSLYWKEYLTKSGIKDPRSVTLKALSSLPLVSKDELRALNPQDLYIEGTGDVIHRTTTGTSGEPFPTQWDAQDFQQWTPNYLRAIPKDIFPIGFDALRRRFFVLLAGFNPTDWPLGHLAQIWDRKLISSPHSHVVHGNSSGFEEFAAQNRPGKFPFAMLFAASERLDNTSRKKLEKYFNAPVRRCYAMRDCGWIAWGCGHEDDTLHINAERIILEIIDSETGKPVIDSPGEIVITILDSWRMPRIRYRTGDIGILQSAPCPCRITLPVIKFVGRASEFLILPSGKKIPALQIQGAIWDIIMTARRIQIKQPTLEKIQVYLVPKSYLTPPDQILLARLEKQLQKVLREKISIEIHITSEVPERKGDKRPFFVPMRHGN